MFASLLATGSQLAVLAERLAEFPSACWRGAGHRDPPHLSRKHADTDAEGYAYTWTGPAHPCCWSPCRRDWAWPCWRTDHGDGLPVRQVHARDTRMAALALLASESSACPPSCSEGAGARFYAPGHAHADARGADHGAGQRADDGRHRSPMWCTGSKAGTRASRWRRACRHPQRRAAVAALRRAGLLRPRPGLGRPYLLRLAFALRGDECGGAGRRHYSGAWPRWRRRMRLACGASRSPRARSLRAAALLGDGMASAGSCASMARPRRIAATRRMGQPPAAPL